MSYFLGFLAGVLFLYVLASMGFAYKGWPMRHIARHWMKAWVEDRIARERKMIDLMTHYDPDPFLTLGCEWDVSKRVWRHVLKSMRRTLLAHAALQTSYFHIEAVEKNLKRNGFGEFFTHEERTAWRAFFICGRAVILKKQVWSCRDSKEIAYELLAEDIAKSMQFDSKFLSHLPNEMTAFLQEPAMAAALEKVLTEKHAVAC